MIWNRLERNSKYSCVETEALHSLEDDRNTSKRVTTQLWRNSVLFGDYDDYNQNAQRNMAQVQLYAEGYFFLFFFFFSFFFFFFFFFWGGGGGRWIRLGTKRQTAYYGVCKKSSTSMTSKYNWCKIAVTEYVIWEACLTFGSKAYYSRLTWLPWLMPLDS